MAGSCMFVLLKRTPTRSNRFKYVIMQVMENYVEWIGFQV